MAVFQRPRQGLSTQKRKMRGRSPPVSSGFVRQRVRGCCVARGGSPGDGAVEQAASVARTTSTTSARMEVIAPSYRRGSRRGKGVYSGRDGARVHEIDARRGRGAAAAGHESAAPPWLWG